MTGTSPGRYGRLNFATLILLLTGLGVTTGQASISEPDHVLYGQVSQFGEPVTEGEITLRIAAWDDAVARYQMLSDPALGSQYALRVPMNSTGDRIEGTAREGDEATVFLDGQPVAILEIGERGQARRVDVDPANLEGTLGVSIDDIQVSEGDAGTTTTAVFTVTLSEPLEDPVGFSWATKQATSGNVAIGGSDCSGSADFISTFGNESIPAGNVSTTLGVTVCGNDDPDGNRIFHVELSNPSDGIVLLKPLGEATIVDNNTVPQLFVEDVTVNEPPVGDTRQAVFRVSLSEEWTETVSVDWATDNGSGVAGQDYVADSGTLQLAPGQQSGQIPVTVLANPGVEADRDFFVDLSNPVQVTLDRNRARGLIVEALQLLVHVETQENGVNVDGMSDPAALSVASPDGNHLYVASRTADELVVFARDTDSGSLSVIESIAATEFVSDRTDQRAIEGINGFADLVIEPGGEHVYAVSQGDDAIVMLVRNDDDTSPDYGRLTVSQVLFDSDDPEPENADPVSGLDGPRGVAVTADGDNVYVASGGSPGHVVVFERDAVTGQLLFLQHLERGQNDPLSTEVLGIANASAVAVSSDNARVYVTGQADDAIAVFDRNLSDRGRLSFGSRYVNGLGGVSGLQAPSSLEISADDEHLYVAGRDSNSVAVFARQANGSLDWIQAVVSGSNGISGLEAPLGLAISSDGELLYAASASDGTEPEPGTLTILQRDSDDSSAGFGQLSFRELKRNDIGGVTGLWGATGVAVSPDDAHIYVAARFDQAVSVFARDLLAPQNPVLDSPSHDIDTWNNQPQIDILWSGAQDLDPGGTNPGSGLQGYSVLFSQSGLSDPDTSIDVAHGDDPHAYQSAPLVDATDHWFHLRSCDNAGNCSDTVSLGPFWIDATAPSGPSGLDSPTHEAGDPGIPENIIEMTWQSAVDSGAAPSGLAGYSYAFNQSSSSMPDSVIELGPAITAVSSAALNDGLWWFHIRAIDNAGNAGAVQTMGPFAVGDDVTPPGVFSVAAVAAPGSGALMPGGVLTDAVTQLLVSFDKPMDGLLADDPDAFRLFDGHVDAGLASCDDPGLSDLVSVQYDGASQTSTLRVGDVTGLDAGDYTLVACDSLADFNGNGLDGDDDGVPGGHFVLPFTVAWDNLLPNPNFDQPLGSGNWGVNESQIVHRADVDIAGVASSGSVMVDVDTGDPTGYAVTRCINLDAAVSSGYSLQARVRLDDPLNDPNPVEATASMTFHSGVGCGDTLQGFVSNSVEADTGGAWIPLSTSISPGAVAGAGSVLVSLNLSFPGGTAYPLTAWFDNTQFFAFSEGQLPSEAPRVVRVLSTHRSEHGDLGQPLPTEAAITQLVPEFSRGVFTVAGGGDPAAANNPANYRLFDLGAGGDPDCSVPSGIALGQPVSYQAAPKRAVVRLGDDRALPAGNYRLVACGTIRDFDDNQLAGGADDTQGVDYKLDFEVAATNILRNPNLDSTAADWLLDFDSNVGDLRWSAADVDGQLSSGALRIVHDDGAGAEYRISQCVDTTAFDGLVSVGARVLTNQAFGAAPQVTAAATFHAEAACGGAETGQLEVSEAMPHSGGEWPLLFGRLGQLPVGSASARVEFTVSVQENVPFDVWLDNLVLRFGASDVIFRNRMTSEIY